MFISPTNLMLESLSPPNRDLILAHCKVLDLPVRTYLQRAGEQPHFAYFLTSGFASVVVSLADGGSSEVAIIGREGVVGGYSLLGSANPPADCFIQMDAAGYEMPLDALRKLFRESEEIRNRILESVQQQAMSMSQIVACNNLHDAEERLARWLLTVQLTVQQDVLHLTQEFLAEMLGTRRTTVAVAAGTLQRAGLIEYKRGKVTIKSHEELRTAACDCYEVIERLLTNLYKN